MSRRIRRLAVLTATGGIGLALWKRFAQGPHTSTPGAPVTYQPTPSQAVAVAVPPSSEPADSGTDAPKPTASARVASGFTATGSRPVAWVPPVDGACPDGYPVKAKTTSKIFHVPGGRSYERTVPDRCYANADAAIADDYRQAKA